MFIPWTLIIILQWTMQKEVYIKRYILYAVQKLYTKMLISKVNTLLNIWKHMPNIFIWEVGEAYDKLTERYVL